ncbi:MAG TPA: DNA-formamidopyrimidine glycosylase family protein [Candidatus Acidoferrales bacterium]|nr:DNA-formamidopyrimidine glycosylase family protein [Candidatus Acidoferrales bacterium]
MPEYPDLTVYVEHLSRRLVGTRLERALVSGPNLLRTFEPPLDALGGREVERVTRLGKRIVTSFAGDLHLALHLMIAGRLHWAKPGRAPRGRRPLARLEFTSGVLSLTEAGTRHRAALHVLAGASGLASLDAGGLEVMDATLEAFAARLRSEDHTLKRALTDPRLFAAIGNAYSDEILHRARLSPLKRTPQLADEETARLYEAVRTTLREWTERLRAQSGDAFPEGVTAFRGAMAVHGRYRQPCPDCGAPVQRIRYAGNETNYCARCQTGGRLLADRALSRLLRSDWPRTLEELEEGRGG